MISIIKTKEKQKYAEINQTTPGTFCFLYKKKETVYEQKHLPQKCRDFLGDTVWGSHNSADISRYGFSFRDADHKLDSDKTRLGVFQVGLTLLGNLPILNEIEKQNGFEPTTMIPFKGGVFIEGDKKWQSYVWTISLYSFLIKVLSYGDLDSLPETSNEAYYKRQVKTFDFLIKNVGWIQGKPSPTVTGWDLEDPYIVHDDSGFVSLFGEIGLKKKENFFTKVYNELLSRS